MAKPSIRPGYPVGTGKLIRLPIMNIACAAANGASPCSEKPRSPAVASHRRKQRMMRPRRDEMQEARDMGHRIGGRRRLSAQDQDPSCSRPCKCRTAQPSAWSRNPPNARSAPAADLGQRAADMLLERRRDLIQQRHRDLIDRRGWRWPAGTAPPAGPAPPGR